jgi:aquaporin Z
MHSSSNIRWEDFQAPNKSEEMKIEAFFSEFVGTYFLVLTVGFNVLQNTALAPISIGAILMAMIFATGKVSGGHFNPAVTLGVYARGKIDGNNAFSYVAVQLIGGLCAGCTYLAMLGASFTLGPGLGYGLAAVCIVEVLFTAALVFVVLSVATTVQDEGNWYFGLAIGFTVMSAAFAIGPISGCSLNPAVTFGVILSNFIHTGYLKVSLLLVYTMAPLLGSLLAVMFFNIIREQEYKVPAPDYFAHHSPPPSHSQAPAHAFALPRNESPLNMPGMHSGSMGMHSGSMSMPGSQQGSMHLHRSAV